MRFNRYEYPIREKGKKFMGSYTILANIKPLGFKGEVLVDSFEYDNKSDLV